MLPLPSAAEPLFVNLSVAFTRPTFQRVLPLAVGAVLTLGRRTVTTVLRTLGGLARGHPSTYHRVFSRAVWSLWPLGKVIATAILDRIPADEPVLVPMDDTTARHRGKKVYGKGCHHDAVRSTHTHVAWRWGHRWVVLAISVKFPFTSRRWALPVLAALYRPKELDEAEGRPHQTAPELARHLMGTLIHWFPDRTFVFLGDGGYASHQLASFCHRHRDHATLVSRFHGDANLYAPRRRDAKAKAAAHASKATSCPPRSRSSPAPRAERPPSVGTAEASATSNGSAGPPTGTRRPKDSSPSAGSSSMTSGAPIATSTSTRPTRRSSPNKSSPSSRPAGPSRRPFRRSAPTWALRPPGSASPTASCGRPRACWGCSAWCA